MGYLRCLGSLGNIAWKKPCLTIRLNKYRFVGKATWTRGWMDLFSCDVLIIGSGAAGLRAAIAAAAAGSDVLVISKSPPGMGTSTIMSRGVFAGADDDGGPEVHRQSTLQAGRGINQVELVDALVNDAPERLRELVKWGVPSMSRNGFMFTFGRPPAWARDVLQCLFNQARGLGVQFKGGLVVDRISFEANACTALAYSYVRNGWVVFGAKAMVLATGGAGALYFRHDNPRHMLGEGYALALGAGAVLQDMEFIQFLPLVLAEPGLPPVLIPPRLANKGELLNNKGEDILALHGIHERPAGVYARDRLSRAMYQEIYQGGKTIWLDLRAVAEEHWLGIRSSPFTRQVLGERYGGRHRLLRLEPAAHHVMGGVRIDVRGATTVPGLFAAGEVTGGLHGANRMGGNGLTETLVFGARAGESAALWAKEQGRLPNKKMTNRYDGLDLMAQGAPSRLDSRHIKTRLQQLLWSDGGILRSKGGLCRALEDVENMQWEPGDLSGGTQPSALRETIEIKLAIQVAMLILQGALRREESRGAHFRGDFPEQNEERWHGHLQCRLSEGKVVWSYEPAGA
jgi:succinate dehydrogenase/fumarate reductase flavoprotein subunit